MNIQINKWIVRLLVSLCMIFVTTISFGDTIKLKSGKVIEGRVFSVMGNKVKIKSGKNIFNIDIRQIDEGSEISSLAIKEKISVINHNSDIRDQTIQENIVKEKPRKRTIDFKERMKNKSGSRRVEVFVTSGCPHCRNLERFLKDNDVFYYRYDIDKSAKGRKKYKALNASGVPVTKVGRKVIHGFKPKTILGAL